MFETCVRTPYYKEEGFCSRGLHPWYKIFVSFAKVKIVFLERNLCTGKLNTLQFFLLRLAVLIRFFLYDKCLGFIAIVSMVEFINSKWRSILALSILENSRNNLITLFSYESI